MSSRRRLRRPLEQRRRADYLTRGAEPALERVLGHERILQRGGAAVREAFDRHDLVAHRRVGEQQAGGDGPAVEENGARTTGALAAGELCPEQLEIVPQDGKQPPPGRLHGMAVSVDHERDGHASRTTGAARVSSSRFERCGPAPVTATRTS